MSFVDAVKRVIDDTEPGELMTYGEVAAAAGRPGAARAVARVLAESGGELPWWRIVTANGRLVPGHEDRQARLLRREGVSVRDGRAVVR